MQDSLYLFHNDIDGLVVLPFPEFLGYPVVQGGVLLVATMIILVNLLVDLLYGVVNPRIRHKK